MVKNIRFLLIAWVAFAALSISGLAQVVPDGTFPLGGSATSIKQKANAEFGVFRKGDLVSTTATNSGNDITLTSDDYATPTFVKGLNRTFIAGFTNSGLTRINLDGEGLVQLDTASGNATVGGEIVSGNLYQVQSAATHWRIVRAVPAWAEITATPTTLAGYGITRATQQDAGYLITKTQASGAFGAFRAPANGVGDNAFQSISMNGTLAGTTYSNFLATSTPDVVSVSGWALRGGTGSNPLVASNFGVWIENNLGTLSWAQELDANNEGATQAEGSDSGGVGLVVNTGSTFSPDTGFWVKRSTGSGTGPGFLRGLVVEGARNIGLRVMAMSTASFPSLTPAAPGTITALAVGISSESQYRFTLNESGKQSWGSGSGAADVDLSRPSAGILSVGGALTVGKGGTSSVGITLNAATSGSEILVPAATSSGTATLPTGTYTLATLGANIFTGDQIISTGTSGSNIVMFNTNATGGINDPMGTVSGWEKNSVGTTTQFAFFQSVIVSPTAGAEASQWLFATRVAGVLATRLTVAAGAQLGSPTGGDKGVGTLNVSSALYENGTALTAKYAQLVTANTFTTANTLAAGTTGLTPLAFQSGTLNTTAVAGGVEYDGLAMYFSGAASARGYVPATQIVSINTNYNLISQTSAQKAFNSSANGQVTLPVGAWHVTCDIAMSTLSATSGAFGWAFGGTATFSQGWTANATKGSGLTGTANVPNVTFNSAANAGLVAANTNTTANLIIDGLIRVTVTGTVIPQVSLGVANAAIVQANSYCEFTPFSATSTTQNIGNWSWNLPPANDHALPFSKAA